MTPKPQSISSELLEKFLLKIEIEINKTIQRPDNKELQKFVINWIRREITSGRLSPAGDVVGALLMVQHKLLRDNPYAPVEHEIKPTWFDIQEAVNAALHGQGEGWMPIETADTLPMDGSHFNLIDMLNGGRPLVAVYFDTDFMECENGTWIEIESYTHFARIPPLPTPSGQPNLEGPDYEDGPEFEGWAERAGIDVATCKHDFGVDSRGDIVRCQICGTPRALIGQPNGEEG
jgi:hypothetical protein